MYKDIISTDNSQHCSVRPLRVKAGSAANAVIPIRYKSRSTTFSSFVPIQIRGFFHHTLRRRCKYFSSAHEYMLFVGSRSYKLSESTGSDYVELPENIIQINKSETGIR
jgi:hypothetical protein